MLCTAVGPLFYFSVALCGWEKHALLLQGSGPGSFKTYKIAIRLQSFIFTKGCVTYLGSYTLRQ
jgi:hypothetical protein